MSPLFYIALGFLALAGAVLLNRLKARVSAYLLLGIAAFLIIVSPAMACDYGGVGVVDDGVVFQQRLAFSSPVYSQQVLAVRSPFLGYRRSAVIVERRRPVVVQQFRGHGRRAAVIVNGY